MGLGLWFAGLIGLVIAAAVTSGRGRTQPTDVASRRVVGIAALAYAALVVSAVWLWGGAMARDARIDRLREGATVEVSIDHVRLAIDRRAAIGHARTAQLHLPGDGADEVVAITLDAQHVSMIEPYAGTRLVTAGVRDLTTAMFAERCEVQPIARDTLVDVPARPADAKVTPSTAGKAAARAPARPTRRKAEKSGSDPAAFRLPAGSEIGVLECDGPHTVSALILRSHGAAFDIVPLSARAGRFVADRRELKAGDALRVGDGTDAIPNLVTWELASPNGASTMLAIPLDPSDCSTWIAGAEHATARDQSCLLAAGPFDLIATPLVPDAEAVLARNATAAIEIGAPALILLLVIAMSPRRGRRARVLGRALRLCVLGGGLVALACWRLVWAHRIDAMHELTARVRDNELAALAIGAALAGNAVLALEVLDGRSLVRRLACGILGWAAWFAGSCLLVGAPPITTMTIGVLGLSGVAATAPALGELAARIARRAPVELGLIAVAVGAWVAHTLHAHGALVKLGLAYAAVLFGHAALRGLFAPLPPVVRVAARKPTPDDASEPPVAESNEAYKALARRATDVWWQIARRGALAGALLVAVAAVVALDAGVALAIAGVGLALAILVAGHDAMYDASQSGRLCLLEREHARLLVAHGVAAAGIAISAAICALVATDQQLAEDGTLAALHAPLVAAGLFAIAAVLARAHRRSWVPWLVAAVAAVAVWGIRDDLLARATAGEGVAARRVAAVVEPGYALLRDDHAFVASASAWREAGTRTSDVWSGQGYFGSRIRDPGVVHSIDNDYFPVLVARETGVAGLLQGVLLLLTLVVGAGVLSAVRLRHASGEQRARWLVTGVIGALAVYQPLASLGVLPLTGITWPGMGIDSPGDLWVLVIGAAWCLLGAEHGEEARALDERVRQTPRVARARRVVIGALIICGLAAVVVVVRGAVCALDRVGEQDERVTAALHYAGTLACAAPEAEGATLDEALSPVIAGRPTDGATTRFERDLHALWRAERLQLVRALGSLQPTPAVESGPPVIAHESRAARAATGVDEPAAEPEQRVAELACPARAGDWKIKRDGDACVGELAVGWPHVVVSVTPGSRVHASCAVTLPDDAVSMLRTTAHAPRERIRVVSPVLGAGAQDVAEVSLGTRIVRVRAGAPAIDLATTAPGVTVAGTITIGGATLTARDRHVVLQGPAELYVADAERNAAWRRTEHGDGIAIDRISLVAAGAADRRVVALVRPPRMWAGTSTIDTLLADTAGDRVRRIYPHGSAIPELGWVNPYEVNRSLGLDGWIHAYRATSAHPPVACGTLEPPPVAPERVCTTNPLDGVVECRVTVQPQLVGKLRALADTLIRDPKPITGRDVTPVRVAFVALRGDTGEILAQASLATGRPALAFAPADARAEAALIALRNQAGEADVERVEWNLPIAVGSTFKPIVARAAELAAPQDVAGLSLTAAGHVDGCKGRRGVAIDPIAGYCPPTSLAGNPTTADVHEFLAHSPNWFQAALGLVGLGLGGGQITVKDKPVTLADVAGSDLATWPPDSPLTIADIHGPILGARGVTLAGLRRTPMWTNVENLLGRPLCTLGDRATCERQSSRGDVCAARALPIAAGADLRNLVALGPDRIDLYTSDKPAQTVATREYLQLLRGSGVHPIGSLAQITDAFGRVVYGGERRALAASWFPVPATGKLPDWSCTAPADRTSTVLGGGGGLCAVVQPGGTAYAGLKDVLADGSVVIYGAKTGTIDSLADIARSPRACARWNANHVATAHLLCGRALPDDSLLVIAFGVVTTHGTIPVTLGIQLQRAGKSAATKAASKFISEIEHYLRD